MLDGFVPAAHRPVVNYAFTLARAQRGWISAPLAFVSPFALPLATTTTLTLAALLWAQALGVSFVGAPALSLSAAAIVISGATLRHLGESVGGRSRASDWCVRLGGAIVFTVLALVTGIAIAMLSYLGARLGFSYQDAVFTRIDATIGFNWLDWRNYVNNNLPLHVGLILAYRSFEVQVRIVFVVLIFFQDRRRSVDLYCALALAGIIACLVSAIVPAVGAGPFFTERAACWTRDLAAVRAAGPASFDIRQLQGVISLPSFHVVVAVLISWACRRSGAFGWAVLVLNAAMVVSALSSGQHYLIDLIAGLAVAVMAILACRAYERTRTIA